MALMIITEKFTSETEDYFREKGWLKPEEKVLNFEKAGEGNMNFVGRVKTNSGSFIVKQSRPYVEKYPQVLAPIERILVEKDFYEIVENSSILSAYSPKIIGFDKVNYILVMEDLGSGLDFLGLYKGEIVFSENEIIKLSTYLVTLHNQKPERGIDNSKMKALNHEHIFNYPFLEDNGFDLNTVQVGLQELALPFKRNQKLKDAIGLLGERYLTNGSTLLHGDFYPGSWLEIGQEIKVIDPEFAFIGDGEFDLAVMIAHLKMALVDESLIDALLATYQKKEMVNLSLLNQYVGVEILRRLIGLAQLPLGLTLIQKEQLATEAANMILAK
jgi:5-methylthioribose kinase